LRPGEGVDGDGPAGEVVEAQAATTGQRIVGGEGRVARFDAQERRPDPRVVDRPAQHADIDDAVGPAGIGVLDWTRTSADPGWSADQRRCTAVVCRPSAGHA
jgi:hypothetical protein